ncbi:MAG: hypothetical protein M3P34_07310 [Actinomycetota bacterium]|nr:hypothetical protein [Actinomycetota bacterium]
MDVQADGIGRYDQDVEAAVYFCTLEALQNITKYAEASSSSFGCTRTRGSLPSRSKTTVAVSTPRLRSTAGSQNMVDRLEALDGHIEIRSAPGRGRP